MEELKFLNKQPFSKQFIGIVRRNIVFFIAFLVAFVTCCLVPIDNAYLGYFDLKTLVCLFCMLLVVCALRNIYFFRVLAAKLIKVFKNTRSAITALVFITYFASMLIANDMALITFLPLGILVLRSTGKEKYLGFTMIMQNIAANLGGMLTPFGNPQNLYLYNFFSIPNAEFFTIMAIPFAVSFVLILLCCLCVKKEPLTNSEVTFPNKMKAWRVAVYSGFFIYSLLIVFRVVPFWSGLLMIPVFLFLDRKALLQVDYMLLATFCMFFVFSGNLARLEPVKNFLSALTGENALLTGVLSCQLISNVPTAVLLANFTSNYKQLLMAVNIAGCGTLLSSLASLITFKHFTIEKKEETKRFLLQFHLINFGFLAILFLVCVFL